MRIIHLPTFVIFLCAGVLPYAEGSENHLSDLFSERYRSVAAVEYFIQFEMEREPREGIGVVLDEEGLIVLNEGVVPGWVPPEQFRDFRVFVPGEDNDGTPATYLGQDHLTGWHYLRADASVWESLVPITTFPRAELDLGESLWGIHLLSGDYNYEPALLRSYVGLIREMPDEMGFTAEDIAVPGSVVFNFEGDFVGWANSGIPEDKILYMGRETFNVALQSVRGTTVFLTAEPFFELAGRVPETVTGDPRPWIGIAGMEPLDKDVSEILGLEDQGAIVISDILEGGPAEAAGLKGRDIVTAVDGKKLPKFLPRSLILRSFERRLRKKTPGDTVTFTVLRDGGAEPIKVSIEMMAAPTTLREAEREYFEPLGLTIREFTAFDGISRRILRLDFEGVIAQFVKKNSPESSAGLQPGDWIQEIDGTQVTSFDQAVELLTGIVEDENREEYVMLINRNNETQVLRIKRN